MAKQKASMKFWLNFKDLSIEVTRKNVKYARLKICRDLKVKFSIPPSFSQTQMHQMLEKHYLWVKNTLLNLQNSALRKNQISFLGKIYELKFDELAKKTEILGDTIISKDKISLEIFLKAQAREKFNKFIEFYKPIINKPINRVCIRKMRSRWGSCNHKKGYINLNLYLIEKSENLIEYVVLHEMTHLIYPNHKKEFYKYIENLMKDYKFRQKELKNS